MSKGRCVGSVLTAVGFGTSCDRCGGSSEVPLDLLPEEAGVASTPPSAVACRALDKEFFFSEACLLVRRVSPVLTAAPRGARESQGHFPSEEGTRSREASQPVAGLPLPHPGAHAHPHAWLIHVTMAPNLPKKQINSCRP